MFLVTSNKLRQLLVVCYIGQMKPGDFQGGLEDIKAEAAELAPGFVLLADFTYLETMGLDCEYELGRMMEFLGQSSVGSVVRIIPDPSKDIGMNIMTAFHYPRSLQVITCPSMIEAETALGLHHHT